VKKRRKKLTLRIEEKVGTHLGQVEPRNRLTGGRKRGTSSPLFTITQKSNTKGTSWGNRKGPHKRVKELERVEPNERKEKGGKTDFVGIFEFTWRVTRGRKVRHKEVHTGGTTNPTGKRSQVVSFQSPQHPITGEKGDQQLVFEGEW